VLGSSCVSTAATCLGSISQPWDGRTGVDGSKTAKVDSSELFCTIPEALEDLRRGRVIMSIDGEEQDSEAHLIAAVDRISIDELQFMASAAGGLMCLALSQGETRRLKLPEALWSRFSLGATFKDRECYKSNASGQCTGANSSKCQSGRLHPLVPVRSHKNGVLSRPAHAEVIVDLAQLAGLSQLGFLCKVVRSDGRPLRSAHSLKEFARVHGLRMLKVSELILYRSRTENRANLLV
jgi:3,4-dihydroxy 2-butanone 4-phosphate synthase/GTP cyclohydrolase II